MFMQNYYKSLKTCIWDSECPEEFENRWLAELEKSQQTNNPWLEKMYELRDRWIPAYVNKYFSAGMSSSQRVESAHAFFKRYCDNENTLMDFVTRFSRALAHQRHEELIEDHRDLNETPNLKLGMPMEVQMAHLYTKKYFQYFQAQLYDGNSYIIESEMEDDSHGVYKTKRVFARNLRMRTLIHDKVSNIVTCSCRMFEFEGIPCRHVLAFLRVKQIMELPKEYILRRWTRYSRIRKERCQRQDGADNSLIMRHNGMFKIASSLIDEAAISPEGTELVKKAFEGLMEQIKKLNLSAEQSSTNNSTIGSYEENRFLDPSQVKTKGSGKRITSWRDKIRKVRRCSLCQSTEHTKKTCTFDGYVLTCVLNFYVLSLQLFIYFLLAYLVNIYFLFARSKVVEDDVDKASGEQDYLGDEL